MVSQAARRSEAEKTRMVDGGCANKGDAGFVKQWLIACGS